MVAVDIDQFVLVVRRADGQLVTQPADAFIVLNIEVAPQQHAAFTAWQRASNYGEAPSNSSAALKDMSWRLRNFLLEGVKKAGLLSMLV